MHVVAIAELTTMSIHLSCQAQITLLKSEESRIHIKYSDFSNVFFSDSVAELPEHTGINDHIIDLLDNKQPLYGPIYCLGLVELETLKTYIKANLVSGFIRPSKSPSGTSILFVRKNDSNFCLYVDYRRLNNLMIKNCYLLLLIGELLNCLGYTKHFTQLDLTNVYH